MKVTGRAIAIRYIAGKYGWDPRRVKNAIIKFADHFGSTREVYYPGSAVVSVTALAGGQYIISEIPLNRVAKPARAGYTDRAEAIRTPVGTTKEATMATRAPARRAAPAAPAKRGTRAKPAPEPEPEDVEEELEEEELEDEEELDDEAEGDEDEQDDEDEEEGDDEEADEEEAEDEGPEDFTPYADKSATPTMSDFAEWLTDEVFEGELPFDDVDEAFLAGVRLGGTLRIKFQQSDFCKTRRDERRAAAAKPAAKPKAAAGKTAPAKAAPAKAPRATAADAKAKPGAAPGKPAGRPRPAAAKPAAPTRRGKKAPY